MKRVSIIFSVAVLLASLVAIVHAQTRAVGERTLSLDDGSGHIVNITVPGMTGPGPYSWVLPITPGGNALSLPTPTTTGSMLYSNGSNSWLENTNVIATGAGAVTANSLSLMSGNISTPSLGAIATALSITAGTGTSGGGNVTLAAGNGSFSSPGFGGNTAIYGGTGYQGGSLQLYGGAGLGPNSGSIAFYTAPPTVGVEVLRMQLTPTGIFEIGASNQFQVDQSGNITGGSLNNTPIGNTNASSAVFNLLTVTASIPNGSAASIANTNNNAGTGQTGLSLGANGIGSQQNVGLQFSVSGATGGNNMDILGSGGSPSWSVSSAGAPSFSGNITAGAHILTTKAIGSATPDGTVVTSSSVTGTDVAGTITLSTSATNSPAGSVSVAFGSNYGTPPTVVVSPANVAGAALPFGHLSVLFVSVAGNQFQLQINCDGTAVTNAKYNYIVVH